MVAVELFLSIWRRKMRVSFARNDGAYLFQDPDPRSLKMVWGTARPEGYVLLSIEVPDYTPDRVTLSKRLIREMLDHGRFSDNAGSIRIVPTDSIEPGNLDPSPSRKRGP
jgi:hypothetical protein